MQLPPVPSTFWFAFSPAFSSWFFSFIPSLLHSFASFSSDKQANPHKGWLRPQMAPLTADASAGTLGNQASSRLPAGKGSAGDFRTVTSTHPALCGRRLCSQRNGSAASDPLLVSPLPALPLILINHDDVKENCELQRNTRYGKRHRLLRGLLTGVSQPPHPYLPQGSDGEGRRARSQWEERTLELLPVRRRDLRSRLLEGNVSIQRQRAAKQQEFIGQSNTTLRTVQQGRA